MSTVPEEFIAILFIIIVIAVFAFSIYKLIQYIEKKKIAFFQKLASRYNQLQFKKDEIGEYGTKNGPLLMGTIAESQFVCFTYTTGSGKQTVHWTKFEFEHGVNLEGYELKLVNEHLFRKMGKSLGVVKEIELGVQDFDKRFLIQSDDLSGTRALLNKQIRDEFISIPKLYFGELVINQEHISYKFPYQIINDKTYNHFRQGLDGSILIIKELKRIYR